MKRDDIVIVRVGAITEIDGRTVRFRKGQIAEAGHPYVKARPHLFKPIEVTYPVEVKAAA